MKLGIINKIEEVSGFNINSQVFGLYGKNNARQGYSQMLGALTGSASMEGYLIHTKEHIIAILIDDQESCCESWGYLTSEDNIQDFVGAEILDIKIVDTVLNIKSLEDIGDLYEGGTMFVNIETAKGMFQIVAYNSHNGYYGHGVLLAIDNKVIASDVI